MDVTQWIVKCRFEASTERLLHREWKIIYMVFFWCPEARCDEPGVCLTEKPRYLGNNFSITMITSWTIFSCLTFKILHTYTMGLHDWDYEGKGLWRSEQRVVFWQTSIKPQVLLEQQLLLVIKKKKKLCSV